MAKMKEVNMIVVSARNDFRRRAEAARIVRSEADDIVFLRMHTGTGSPDNYFSDFSEVDPCEVNGPFQVRHNV